MLQGLFVLLLMQLAGEAIARGLALPIPGPVIGVVLLVAALALRARFHTPREGGEPPAVEAAADGLLRHLGLLFVPAGVGIAQSVDALDGRLVAVIAALVGSTVITLLATVATFRLVSRAVGGRAKP